MTAPSHREINVDITQYMSGAEAEIDPMFDAREGAPDAARFAVWEG